MTVPLSPVVVGEAVFEIVKAGEVATIVAVHVFEPLPSDAGSVAVIVAVPVPVPVTVTVVFDPCAVPIVTGPSSSIEAILIPALPDPGYASSI